MSDMKLEHVPFLSKEAALPNPMKALKFLRGIGRPAAEAVGDLTKAEPQSGKFVTNVGEQVGGSAENTRFFSPEEIEAKRRAAAVERGSGSLPLDAVTGLLGKVTPKSWDVKGKAQNLFYNIHSKMEKADTAAGSFLAGDNPNNFRGRLFSVHSGDKGHGVHIGDKTNLDGTISPIMEGTGVDRRPSLLAPVQNGIQMASPFLAATYVADKLYPHQHEATNQTVQTASSANDYFEKFAHSSPSASPEHDMVVKERVAWELEKQAQFNKIAQLEDELEKTAAHLRDALEDNRLLVKEATDERLARQHTEGMLKEAKDKLMDKSAEYEELRLRTIARERSHAVVKMAEAALERGLIKQAEKDAHVDRLMACDEETFNLFASMVKSAAQGEEGLESLAFLSDYSSNESDSTPSRLVPGLSRNGQTINEAARSLLQSK